MRTIVHISDIHFGRVDYAAASSLIVKINELAPSVVVVSGDLTQRARSAQFIEARAFLDKLPKPQIVVPGNHDIPMHNVFARFATPLEKYKRYITADLEPFFTDEEIAVLGVNTARSLTVKDGRINERQVGVIREKLCGLKTEILKIVVTHHPFDLPEGFSDKVVGRAQMAMSALASCGADLFLAGHIHVSHIGHTATRYKLGDGQSALVVQAGTATSTRGRGEANSFNFIEFEHPQLTVKRFEYQTAQTDFALAQTQIFSQTEKGWQPILNAL